MWEPLQQSKMALKSSFFAQNTLNTCQHNWFSVQNTFTLDGHWAGSHGKASKITLRGWFSASEPITKENKQNSQKGHFAEAKKRTRRSQKHATRDNFSFHTLYKPWKTFVPIQIISNEVQKHAKSRQTQFPWSSLHVTVPKIKIFKMG